MDNYFPIGSSINCWSRVISSLLVQEPSSFQSETIVNLINRWLTINNKNFTKGTKGKRSKNGKRQGKKGKERKEKMKLSSINTHNNNENNNVGSLYFTFFYYLSQNNLLMTFITYFWMLPFPRKVNCTSNQAKLLSNHQKN